MLARRILCVVAGGALLLGLLASPASAAGESGKGRCVSELSRAGLIGRGANPGQANIIAGTEGDDDFGTIEGDLVRPGQLTDGVDLVCGFGGNDTIYCCNVHLGGAFGEGDIFLGGDGNDSVYFLHGATFYGGPGDDLVLFMDRPGEIGEPGTFHGGDGNDEVRFQNDGIFNGDAGIDFVSFLHGPWEIGAGGTFNGGDGDDYVIFNQGGTFNGGPGDDYIQFDFGGTFNQ